MSFFLWKDMIKLGAPCAISQPLRSNGEIKLSRSLEDFCRERLIKVCCVKGATSTDIWSVRDQRIFEERRREMLRPSNRGAILQRIFEEAADRRSNGALASQLKKL
ncbi:hypothetical protein MRB53_030420 [Persea americana]|uniref:Uncharacterized protein n=1 Tax=Persea americana TaxID=3435 RepID=A0ACC2KLH4_PERAE|nr:hypothetical protein MRB53_030420 [Persea americana]